MQNKWCGRPYDDMHKLTFTQKRPFTSLIELDEHLLLVFTDDLVATIEDSMLILDGFTDLAFIWRDYGETISRPIEAYSHAQVTFDRLLVE